MGVTGLWTVVAPTARPTQLASLNRKRLAVDASIWIYQFLKAVRDKEGNALRNSHVVGFFRRICKLLYFGIKPVFVFDGGAPILKRETLRKRVRRREGRREDAARTAGKLLAVQVARAAEEEDKRRKAEKERAFVDEDLPADQDLVYVEELGMTQKERQVGRGFKRKDQYHLPDLDVSIENMGAPNDPRIMSQVELEEYAKQFHSGEDINFYDFSKIDFESPFFLSLPPGDRYNILNAARLRSRLRMGYSKDQLDGMFPDRMAFSKFQIERVKERNELTQRLMHINGMAEDFFNQGGRIAGEKGKEYVLVKNDGVEGGWALGVVSNKQGTGKDNAIDLDDEIKTEEDSQSSENENFEDIAIEGLNRIPKVWQKRRVQDQGISQENIASEIAKKRKAVYDARAAAQSVRSVVSQSVREPDPLFVAQDENFDEDVFEDVALDQEEDYDDLQKAIAMSLHTDISSEDPKTDPNTYTIMEQINDSNEDSFDLQAALAESRKSKHQSKKSEKHGAQPSERSQFNGPLPFESLNLGQSLLGKRKSKKVEEDMSGGFERNLGDETFRKERPLQSLPSWFDAVPDANDHKRVDDTPDEQNDEFSIDHDERVTLSNDQEVIDIDALNEPNVIDIECEENAEPHENYENHDKPEENEWEMPVEAPFEEDPKVAAENERLAKAREERYRIGREIAAENESETLQTENEAHGSVKVKNQEQDEDLSDMEGAEADWSESERGDVKSILSSTDSPEKRNPSESPFPGIQDPENDQDIFEDVEIGGTLGNESPPNDESESMSANPYIIPENADQTLETKPAEEIMEEENLDYLSDSDEELMRQLAVEAEEHARFASSLNSRTPAEAARDYENELKQLRNQQKKDRRDADEVTQTMVQECQALLRLFGLPYITAPMEAEAQCAELVHLGLVDGIVTDDSDIFLFGGTRIYKNMFNAAKYVECYLATDLEKEYALDRKKLIRFAHLLGSDYTEGIPGVGPVTALEILTDFDTLEEFKQWCANVQLGRPQDMENQLTTSFRRKFRNTAQKRLFLPPSFPDTRVDQSYLNPEVDSDPEEFQWGIPDLDKLRRFLMSTIGWNQERTDEILVPVVRDMNKRDVEGTQANITRFFSGGVGIGAKEAAAPRNRTGKESGRMAKAYARLRNEAGKRDMIDDQSDQDLNAKDIAEVSQGEPKSKRRKHKR